MNDMKIFWFYLVFNVVFSISSGFLFVDPVMCLFVYIGIHIVYCLYNIIVLIERLIDRLGDRK